MALQLIEKAKPKSYKPSDKDKEDLIKQLNDAIVESSDFCEPEHSRSEENARYERGFQWREADAQRQQDRERPALPLNNLVKIINAVANREIMDRYVPKVFGRSNEDWGVAEFLDESCKWQRDMAETEHEESMAFRKSCASGYGVMHKWWDDSAFDGLGQIKDEEVPLWQMLWDPRARKQNLVDRRYHISGKFVPVDEVMEIYAGDSRSMRNKLRLYKESWKSAGNQSGRSTGNRWGWRDVAAGRWWNSAKEETFVIEYEYMKRKSVFKAAVPTRLEELISFASNPEGQMVYGFDDQQQPQVLTNQQWQQMDEPSRQDFSSNVLQVTDLVVFEKKRELDDVMNLVSSFTGRDLVYVTNVKDVCEFAIVTGNDIILKQGIRPMGFTYEFLTGLPFETRDGMRFYGMIDIGKGPQDFKNVFYSNALAQYMTSPKNQLLVEESLVENPNAFLNDYSKLGGVTFVPDGFVQSFDSRVKQLDSPQFPPMLKELIMVVESALEDLFGLSSIEMGSQGDLRRVSGTASAQARQASNTILAVWFDGLKRFRKRFGMLNVKFLQFAYEPSELVRVVGEDVAQGIAEVSTWPEVNRLDIKIDESPTSISEQIDTIDKLTRTGTLDKWVDSGKLAFEDAIDMMVNLPKSLRERIKKNSQAMQKMMQQVQQLQQQLQQEQEKMQLMQNFMLTVDRGGQIKTAFETVYGMAMQMDQERQQMQQQQQANQGPAPQAQ